MQKSCIDRLNKKRKIEDTVVQIFNESGLSFAEIIEYCKSVTRKFTFDMASIVFADWFYLLLFQYLNLIDIANFDLAICNRKIRPQWLDSLGKFTFSQSLKIFESVFWCDTLINWIIQRNLHFGELAINEGYSEISNDGIYRLAQQCPKLEVLKLCYYSQIRDDLRIQYMTAMCNKLKRFELFKCGYLSSSDYVLLGACGKCESITIVITIKSLRTKKN